MTIPARWRTHTITVEPYLGSGAFGPEFGPPVEVACRVEDQVELVRSNTGEEVVSTSTVLCEADTVIPAGSRVTVNGRQTTVLNVSTHITGGLSGLDHIQAALA